VTLNFTLSADISKNRVSHYGWQILLILYLLLAPSLKQQAHKMSMDPSRLRVNLQALA